MFKNTAIALGLAMVTGAAFAGTGMSATGQAGASTGGGQASMSSNGSLTAEFHKLDTNNDGVLSPSEAKANPRVAKLYDSMDTNASIKSDPHAKKSDESSAGITLNQFKAGMHAATGGAAGPAVSGGETYTVMKNGTKRVISNSEQKAGNTMKRTQQGMRSAGQSMRNSASQTSQSAQDRMSGMKNNMQNQASQMQSQANGMRNTASQSMQRSGSTMSSGNSMKANAKMQTQMSSQQKTNNP